MGISGYLKCELTIFGDIYFIHCTSYCLQSMRTLFASFAFGSLLDVNLPMLREENDVICGEQVSSGCDSQLARVNSKKKNL